MIGKNDEKGTSDPRSKKKSRGKKNWQSMGFKTYLEFRHHLLKESDSEGHEELKDDSETKLSKN